MTDDLHQRAKQIFVAASDLPTEAREAFVSEECAGDRALWDEVMSLLGYHDLAGSASAPAWTRARWDGADSIGAYRLLEKLGEGGMGVVYEAEQTHPVQRRVAVKLIKWGMDTREVLARFESERQALALMDHPAIARVYEAGATDHGRPYFAMELARGSPVTEYCDAHAMPMRDRLRLFVEVCMGVQHAHQKGIIHRDLKPSNLIVTEQDGRPAPKIIDFGISRATGQRDAEQTMFTRLGQCIGTPEYMSPEQAEPGGVDIDTRTDVYSLGVVLYEILTGSIPFDTASPRGSGYDELRRQIREVDPQRPSTRVGARGEAARIAATRRRLDPRALVRALRGDLDWIVMKAIEKDRSRRYGSAAELAADIERHLAYEPVLAGPPSTAYRLGKLVRRHRLGFGAAAVVGAALLLGMVGTAIGLRRAERSARAAMRTVDALAGVFLVMDPAGPSGPAFSVTSILRRGAEQIESELADQPELQARVLTALGQVHLGLGQYEKARLLLERAVDLQRRHPPQAVDEVLSTLIALAWVNAWSGDLDGARRVSLEGLRLSEEASPPRARAQIAFRFSLAWLSWRSGDVNEAQAHVDRAAEVCDKSISPTDPAVADVLYMQALLCRERGEAEASRRSLERCLAIRERAYGPENVSVAWAILDLGFTYQALRQRDKAREHFERCLQLQEKLLGPDHPWLAYALTQLGVLALQDGDEDGAFRHLDRALRLRERGLGPDHPDVVWTLLPLAELYRQKGEFEASRSLLERAERIVLAAFPRGHPDLTRVLIRLERNARETGRLDDARMLLARLEQLTRRPGAERQPSYATDVYNVACIAALQGNKAHAIELLRAAVAAGFVNAFVFEDPDLASLEGTPELAEIRAEVRRRLAAPRSTSAP
ncbi:MAG: tetratricopeptide repeat protein [Acidobacteriota bacterium]